MSKTPSTATLVGKVIGALISNALTFWAAVETHGLIHGVLIGHLALGAVVWIAYGTIAIAKSERATYGDVHVNIKGDASQFAASMGRATDRAKGLDGIRR